MSLRANIVDPVMMETLQAYNSHPINDVTVHTSQFNELVLCLHTFSSAKCRHKYQDTWGAGKVEAAAAVHFFGLGLWISGRSGCLQGLSGLGGI